MMEVLLVVHLLVTLVMIGLILLQRSEGGGLGIGGGSGGMGALAGPRATANILSRATKICFILFVGISLVLAVMANMQHGKKGVLEQLDVQTLPVNEPVQNAGQGGSFEPVKTPVTEPEKAPQVPVSK